MSIRLQRISGLSMPGITGKRNTLLSWPLNKVIKQIRHRIDIEQEKEKENAVKKETALKMTFLVWKDWRNL